MKRPAILFYTGDWLSDTKLSSCSLAAQGLWINLLCVMHDSEDYGKFCLSKIEATAQPKVQAKSEICLTLTRMMSGGPEEISSLLNELLEKKVVKIDTDGYIFSSRMIRDEYLRKVRTAAGSKGGKKSSFKKKFAQANIDNDHEIEKDNIKDLKEGAGGTFQKPTLEEIMAYCKERNNQVDAQAWMDHYESNGWMVGKNKMKDWHASVRTWEKNNFQNNVKQKPCKIDIDKIDHTSR
ncbi:MAG: hypothetical protein HY841_13845 [Bacteroidetes bacterium]|nr:hypothetical protein [Bacteroidota bacterium]